MRESLSSAPPAGEVQAPPAELSAAADTGGMLPVATPGLPAHVVSDFAIGDVGRTHCTGCGRSTGYVVHQMVFSLPQAGFSISGLAGVCVECNTLTAMQRMSFDAVAAAWNSRPDGADRMSLVVRRAGESEAAYRDRLASAMDTGIQEATHAPRAAGPALRLVGDRGPLPT